MRGHGYGHGHGHEQPHLALSARAKSTIALHPPAKDAEREVPTPLLFLAAPRWENTPPAAKCVRSFLPFSSSLRCERVPGVVLIAFIPLLFSLHSRLYASWIEHFSKHGYSSLLLDLDPYGDAAEGETKGPLPDASELMSRLEKGELRFVT